ncbi:MAG TPA: helix-turn-helix transcriptional regulator [Saprospiraceae bacterium]|nr:helix-turn-helix transcriptional regulator [Saprospiraceae bacterium]
MIAAFIKQKRQEANLNQTELAEKAGVGLRFIRDIEQGKETLRLDKVNQVLKMFGYQLGPVEINRNYLANLESGDYKHLESGATVNFKKKKK